MSLLIGTRPNAKKSSTEASIQDKKSIEITENGIVEILPDEGYDGMAKVTANVNTSSFPPDLDNTYFLVQMRQADRAFMVVNWYAICAKGEPEGSILVDWGDGSSNTYQVTTQDNTHINHIYATGGEYVIKVTSTTRLHLRPYPDLARSQRFIQVSIGRNIADIGYGSNSFFVGMSQLSKVIFNGMGSFRFGIFGPNVGVRSEVIVSVPHLVLWDVSTVYTSRRIIFNIESSETPVLSDMPNATPIFVPDVFFNAYRNVEPWQTAINSGRVVPQSKMLP